MSKLDLSEILPKFKCPDCGAKLHSLGKKYKCDSCGRIFLFNKRNIEILPIGFNENKWINEELDFWNANYRDNKTSKINGGMEDRLYVRRKMIEYLKEHKKINANTRILDVGAGSGFTSYHLLNPDTIKHSYFALDISEIGLKLLRRRVKSAITVRSTIEIAPFEPKSFDVIFIWGVLHHTKSKEQIIGPLTKLLKKGGYMLMYEGLKPESLLLKWTSRIMKQLIKESAHEERIDEKRFKKAINKNLNVVWYEKEYTPVRTILVILMYKIEILRKYNFVSNFILALDYFLIHTLGKKTKIFSGGAVSVIGIKK